MKTKILIIIFCLNSWCAESQINLVPNGSFETITSFPQIGGEIKYAAPWTTTHGSPDLFSTFGIDASPGICCVCVPKNAAGFQYPRTGSNFAGIASYADITPNIYREMIGIKLIDTLKKNKCYLFKMYYALANSSSRISATHGVYFSDTLFFLAPNDYTTTTIPQILQDTVVFNSDTLKWQLISGVYKANGGEGFISIGNFRTQNQIVSNFISNYNNTTLSCGWGNNSIVSYYYIDDVSLQETYFAPLINDTTLCYDEEIYLGSDEIISGLTYTWQPAEGLSCVNCSNPKAKITKTTTYVLTTQFCDAVSSDSIKLTMKYCMNKNIPNIFTPNGDDINEVWQAIIPKGSTNINCNIYSRWGNVVYSLTAEPPITNAIWDGHTPSGEACSTGIYFYTLTYKDAEGVLQGFKGCISLLR